MKFIYSYGGFSREFARCLKTQYPNEEVWFVDDNPTGIDISYAEALKIDPDRKGSFVIGFADGALRRKKANQVINDGFSLFSVKSSTSIIGENITIAEGYILSDFTIITADAKIGSNFHCNIYSYIAHDCIIGDFVTLAPRVSVNGRVTMGNNVYIGTGATVLPGKDGSPLNIGTGAIIGSHALVTKDVPDNTTVVGIPAKPLIKR